MAVFSARKCLLILKVSNFPPLKTDAKIRLYNFGEEFKENHQIKRPKGLNYLYLYIR